MGNFLVKKKSKLKLYRTYGLDLMFSLPKLYLKNLNKVKLKKNSNLEFLMQNQRLYKSLNLRLFFLFQIFNKYILKNVKLFKSKLFFFKILKFYYVNLLLTSNNFDSFFFKRFELFLKKNESKLLKKMFFFNLLKNLSLKKKKLTKKIFLSYKNSCEFFFYKNTKKVKLFLNSYKIKLNSDFNILNPYKIKKVSSDLYLGVLKQNLTRFKFLNFKHRVLNNFVKILDIKSVFNKKYKKILKLKKTSYFGKKINIYQKFRYYYGGISKAQILNYYLNALKFKRNALAYFLLMLESRLDIFLYRLNFFNSLVEARQYLLHHGVFINNRITYSYTKRLNNLSVLIFKASDKKMLYFRKLKFLQLFKNFNKKIPNIYFFPKYIEFNFSIMGSTFSPNLLKENKVSFFKKDGFSEVSKVLRNC